MKFVFATAFPYNKKLSFLDLGSICYNYATITQNTKINESSIQVIALDQIQ